MWDFPSQLIKKRSCSWACRKVYQRKEMAGNKFRVGMLPANAFKCGEHMGSAHPGWKPRIAFHCINCGKQFEKIRWQTRGAGRRNIYCSIRCRGEYKKAHLSGINAPDYVGGPLTYRGRGWLAARKATIEKQGGQCATCGVFKGDSLPVHHILPFRYFSTVAQANSAGNLIGLCQSCHMKTEPRSYRRDRTALAS